jgi:hypothetical protein
MMNMIWLGRFLLVLTLLLPQFAAAQIVTPVVPFFGSGAAIPADDIDRIPTMTGATTSGVTMSTSNANAGFPAWQAGDDNNGTSWITQTGNTAADLKVDFGAGNEKVIQSYTMTEIHAGEWVSGARTPKNWTFEASNDNSNWTTLDTQSSQTAVSANNKRTFTISNQTSFRYYRLNVQANGPGNLIGLAEVEFRT